MHARDVGPRPWLVILGCFCLSLSVYGLLSAIGLFQTYWAAYQLAGREASEISWIISLFGFAGCFFAAPAGMPFDRYGVGTILAAASTAYVACFVGLAWAETYERLMGWMLVAGVFSGLFVCFFFFFPSVHNGYVWLLWSCFLNLAYVLFYFIFYFQFNVPFFLSFL